MRWPLVWRYRLEALQESHLFCDVRYKDLEYRFQELRQHADKLLEAVSTTPAALAEAGEVEPMRPRRPLGRDIVAAATAAKELEHQRNQGAKAY